MQESYAEGPASHCGLGPYAGDGNIVGVASARGTGRPAIELRNHNFRVPTLCCLREGNTRRRAMASGDAARRSRRSESMSGNSKRENREIPTASDGMPSERSANVQDGTADMDAAGKSDELVVPTTQANKRGCDSCGRSLPREGVRPRETCRGQHGRTPRRKHHAKVPAEEYARRCLDVRPKVGAV